jgi:hypothetical protein
MAFDKTHLATVQLMWRREVEAAATYRHLANRERDPRRKDILMRLAEQEKSTPPAGRSASPPPPDACPTGRKSSAACPGSSAFQIRTSCSIASNRRRTKPRRSTSS